MSIYLLTIFTRLDIFSISSEQIQNTRALPKSRIQLHLGSEDLLHKIRSLMLLYSKLEVFYIRLYSESIIVAGITSWQDMHLTCI